MRGLRALAGWGRIYWRHRVLTRAAPRLANVRDLADAAPGLARAVAYRSDAPRLRDHPPQGLTPWPPATVIDLRAAGEKAPEHPLAAHARIVNVDLLDSAALDGGGHLGSLTQLYERMMAADVAPGLVRVVDEVARHDAPVLIHCSAGKDRTGLTVALILRLVGVAREHVVADYVLTQQHMPGVLARLLSDRRKSVGRSPLASVPHEILEAPASAIEAVLDAWDAHPDGTTGWYLTHGGDPDTLAALRARLAS